MKWRETRACGMSFQMGQVCSTSLLGTNERGMSWLGVRGRGMSCLGDSHVTLGRA